MCSGSGSVDQRSPAAWPGRTHRDRGRPMSTSKPEAVRSADSQRGVPTEGEPDGGTATRDGMPSTHARSHARASSGLANWSLRLAQSDRECGDLPELDSHRGWALALAGVESIV